MPNLQLPVMCNREKVPLKLYLDLNEPPAEGRSILGQEYRSEIARVKSENAQTHLVQSAAHSMG